MDMKSFIKNMFTNDPLNTSVRSGDIFHNVIHIDDIRTKVDMYVNDNTSPTECNNILKHTSMMYLLSFKYEVADLFMQFAENLRGYKIYPFEKEIIVICNLSVYDVKRILLHTRFANNPFYYNLIQDVYENMYPDMFPEFIKDDEFHVLDTNLFVRDKQELTDDDENPLPKENEDMAAEFTKILSYDNVNEIKKTIIDMYPKMAGYLTEEDLFDICKFTDLINFQYTAEYDSLYSDIFVSQFDTDAFYFFDNFIVTLSYRELINNSISFRWVKSEEVYFDENYKEFVDKRLFEMGYLIGEKLPKVKELMNSDKIQKPMMLETQNYDTKSIKDEDVDEVLSTELINSSEVPQSNIIKGEI